MQCVSPITLRDPVISGSFNTFPCGKCKYCKEIRRSQWSFRLHQELQNSETAAFYTLTYEDIYLPLKESPPLSGSYAPTLVKEDVQLFIKRLRSHLQRKKRKGKYNHLDRSWELPLRYFAVGEYGDQNGRPHYHALIFNIPYEEQVIGVKDKWAKGNIHVGDVNEASIHYCTKYMLKDENDMRALMSRRPGIGANYLENKEVKKWHESGNDYVSYNGFPMAVPRYYKQRYLRNSKNFRKVEYWDKVKGEPIIRYERTEDSLQKMHRAIDQRENKIEKKYIAKGKNPITDRGEEDRNRYKRFGNKFKNNKLD
jgi:hypothetical protein